MKVSDSLTKLASTRGEEALAAAADAFISDDLPVTPIEAFEAGSAMQEQADMLLEARVGGQAEIYRVVRDTTTYYFIGSEEEVTEKISKLKPKENQTEKVEGATIWTPK